MRLNIYMAQFDAVVGDITGNAQKMQIIWQQAVSEKADVVIFPELALSGYPPEDLVLRDDFLKKISETAYEMAALTKGTKAAMIVGSPWKDEDGVRHNAALVLQNGKISDIVNKRHLPNYGVFDEARVFEAGQENAPVDICGVKLGILVCEDMWFPAGARTLKNQGAEILLVINASPFETGKPDLRRSRAESRVRDTGLPLLYLNLCGGQDEVVFDGGSFVLSRTGRLTQAFPAWKTHGHMTTWEREEDGWRCHDGPIVAPLGRRESVWRAMMAGLRAYVDKNGFPGVLIGLSGGIDSAISVAIAVDALGADRVWCVMMPSAYTSQESIEDAAEVARLCRVKFDTIPIGDLMDGYDKALAPLYANTQPGLAEENIQARIRGALLMALSNKFGHMLLTTSNKSEASVGYSTLYGDMCGGYSVIKDLYKTRVYQLARWRNKYYPDGFLGPAGAVMPERIITKPPSAELRHNQTDQDSLPSYEILDAILEGLIENGRSVADLVAIGFDEQIVRKVWTLLDRAEYKRRQAPPGVKISTMAFGRDRRFPITNGFTVLI